MSDVPGGPEGRLLSGPPAYRPATPWRAVPAVLTTVAILVAAISAMALIFLGSGPADAANVSGRLWGLAVMQAVAVALTLLVSWLHAGRLREVLALGEAPTGWRAYAGAILAMAVFQAVLAAAQHFLLRHDLLTDLRPFVGLVTGAHWPLAAAVMAVGAPLSEELLFRGFLLGALAKSLEKGLSVPTALLLRSFPGALARRRLGFWPAAFISTAAWSALHYGYSLLGLAEVFAIGLFLSWLLWRTGSLWVTIFCHAAYNGAIVLALLLLGLPTGG